MYTLLKQQVSNPLCMRKGYGSLFVCVLPHYELHILSKKYCHSIVNYVRILIHTNMIKYHQSGIFHQLLS